jgi:hypothetical protein
MLVAGCAPVPAGVDGDLANGWPALAAAGYLKPVVGTCYLSSADYAEEVVRHFVVMQDNCGGSHTSETAYVGTLAEAPAPPTGKDLRPAMDECRRGATDYLGADWHRARVELTVLTPTGRQWSGGSRYFECQLIETKSEDGVIVTRTGSLKDGLRGDAPLARRCVNLVGEDADGNFDDFTQVPCDQAHRGEYAGTADVGDVAWPADDKAAEKVFSAACAGIVASYLGMTLSQFSKHRQVGWMFWGTSEAAWAVGLRSANCYVWLPKTPEVRRSLRGMGNKSL